MRNVTVPSPCPSTLDVNVIHAAGVVARQAHSRATVIVTEPVPPDGLKADGGPETDA